MSSVQLLTPGPLRLGSRARVVQPRLGTATWQVSEYEEGRSFAWVSRRPGVTATGRHELQPAAGGTRLRLAVEFRGPIAPIVGALAGSLTSRYLELELAGLKRAGETA